MIPQNIQRNKDLIRKRDGNPARWTFAALGKHFRIKPATAFEIYHREKTRKGTDSPAPVSAFIAKKYPALAKGKKIAKSRTKKLSTTKGKKRA